jgi:Na+-translocating ferredoxin:NAD+ oxidoreductase RnfG subunit
MLRQTLLRRAALLFPALIVPRIVRSEDYMSVEQAQRILFGEGLTRKAVTLSSDQKKAIEKASGTRVRNLEMQVWRAGDGGWFIVDEVIGKHEFITYALGLTSSGAVKGVEILTYRETYGHEVKLPKWRAQFLGKTMAAPVKIDKDIKNISGATLSCMHVTEGVRRLLYTHALVLKNL